MNAMEKEYDFSQGERGKFYHPDVHLNLPIYLDDDIADAVVNYAEQRKVDVQTAVNEILRQNRKLLQSPR